MHRRIEAHLFLRRHVFVASPEAAMAVGSHLPLFAIRTDKSEFALAQNDAKIAEPCLVGAVVARVAGPLSRCLEIAWTFVPIARNPTVAVKGLDDFSILPSEAHRKQLELGIGDE